MSVSPCKVSSLCQIDHEILVGLLSCILTGVTGRVRLVVREDFMEKKDSFIS